MATIEEIKIVTTVDSGSSSKTLKDLIKQVNDLETSISKLDKTSDKYISTLEKLVVANEELTGVLSGASDTSARLTESMSSTTDAIVGNADAVAGASTSYQDATTSTTEYTSAQDSATESTQENVRTIKTIRSEINGYKDELTQLRRGSDEYRNTLEKLSASQKELNNINADIRASSLNVTDQYRQLSTVASGAVAGITALISISSLLGKENEELVKTLVKIQAGLQLTSALTAVSNGFKAAQTAARSFGITLNALPIFAVIGAVTALIAIFNKFKTTAEQVTVQTDILGRTSFDRLTNQISQNSKILSAQGQDQVKVLEYQLEQWQKATLRINKAYNDATTQAQKEHFDTLRKSALQNAVDTEAALTVARISAIKAIETTSAEELKQIKAINDSIGTEYGVAIKELEKTYNERRSLFIKYNQDTTALDDQYFIDRAKLQDDFSRQDSAFWANYYNDQLNQLNNSISDQLIRQEIAFRDLDLLIIQQQQALLEAQQAGNYKQVYIEQEKLNELLALQEQNSLFLIEQQLEQNEQNLEILREAIANELIEYEERLNLQEQLREAEREQLSLQQDFVIATTTAEINQGQRRYDADVAFSTARKKLRLDELKSTEDFLNASQGLFSENTVASKVLGSASATISTYTAAAQVLANPTNLSPVAKFANFAAVIATGLSAVKSIWGVDVPGASGGGSSGSTATDSATVSLPTMPELDTSIYEVHNNMDAYDEDVINQQQTVLVAEDYQEVRNRIDVADTESSF